MRSLEFELQAVCPVTGARAGLLKTAHGDIPTPVFMPVGTQATVKAVSQRDLIEELDAKIILANTYHLFLRPGHELIERFGGLHGFMQWPRAILTDSGGFQVLVAQQAAKGEGRGRRLSVALERGSPPLHPRVGRGCAARFQQRHFNDARRVHRLPGHPGRRAQVDGNDGSLGAPGLCALRGANEITPAWERPFPDRAGFHFLGFASECARELIELDADGYALGGLSVGEPRELSLEMTETTAPLLPLDRPRYVMGVGTPAELSEYVARGVDMMDCVMPSRNARNGCLFTSQGKLHIKQARFHEDPLPVDPTCGCYTCRTFSRAYLRHLFISGEILFSTLATIHNLWHYLDIMRRMRQAILLGTFPEFLKAARALPAEV